MPVWALATGTLLPRRADAEVLVGWQSITVNGEVVEGDGGGCALGRRNMWFPSFFEVLRGVLKVMLPRCSAALSEQRA
jgi:hypothetical protein